MAVTGIDLGKYKLGWHDSTDDYVYAPKKGLNEAVVRDISSHKDEPEWMTNFRLRSLARFERKPMLDWFARNMPDIDFDDIYYYLKPTEKTVADWNDLPDDMKRTYERLGIPEAEGKFLAGVTAQFESEVVYHKNREDLEAQGILFTSMDQALKDYPDLVREHFGTVIPPGDNKFAALNSAVWSGGCLTADARINVLGRGFVSIADVCEGDEVFGIDEARNLQRGTVLATMESGTKPVYRIRVAGRTLEATGNHPFLVARRAKVGTRTRWVSQWLPLDEIEVGEPVALARHLLDDGAPMRLPTASLYTRNRRHERLTPPPETTTDLMWVLGLWLGDGHTANNGDHMCQVSFSIPKEDPVYDAARATVMSVFGIDHVTDVKCGFVVSSKQLGTFLSDIGFIGHAKTKRLPSWVFGLPHVQQLALLGGLIDTDGWTERDGMSMCVELTNPALLEDVRQLAVSCGLTADGHLSTRTRTVEFPDGRLVTATSWRLRIQGELDRVGSRSPTKQGAPATAWRRNPYQAATGMSFSTLVTATVGFAVLKEKTPVGDKPTFDIQVADLESFATNGILAHNSFIYVPPGVHVDMPLQAYFRINAENSGQFERTLIIADEGSSVHYVEGCLLAGERIDMANGGWLPVEEVTAGDQVVDHAGTAVTVTEVMTRDYDGAIFRFVPLSGANAFTTTGEHPLLVVRREEVSTARALRNNWLSEVSTPKLEAASPQWVRAASVARGDFLVYPVSRPALQPALAPEFIRLAGYYLAEGSAQLINGCKALTFSFHEDELEYVEEVRSLCDSLWGKRGSVFKEKGKRAVRITVYTNEGYDDMVAHVGVHSLSKRLSPQLLGQTDESLATLVDSYVNGDGCRTQRNGATPWVRAHTISYDWALQLQSIMARLDIFATVTLDRPGGPGEIMGRKIVRNPLWRVQWTSDKVHTEVRRSSHGFLVPVKHIEQGHHRGPVFNFETTPSHSYTVRGFATHNCSAPVYTTDSLHSAVVELIAKPGSRIRYTTIQNWSPNVYNLVTKRARAETEATVEWIDGNLGCIAAGSSIITRDGPKPIEDVLTGEEVLSYDEQAGGLVFQPVTAKRFSGYQPVREISSAGRSIRVTDNHPFYSYNYDSTKAKKSGRYSLGWVPAEDVAEVIVPVTSLDFGKPYKFELCSSTVSMESSNQWGSFTTTHARRGRALVDPLHTSKDVAWLVGLYLGDGSISGKRASHGGYRCANVQFSVPTFDRAHARLQQVMAGLLPDVLSKTRRDGILTSWPNAALANTLELNGLGGNAYTKRIPAWALGLPEAERLSLLAGMVDSDGTVSGRTLSIKSVNLPMLKDAAQMLITLGVPYRIHSEPPGDRHVTIAGYNCVARPANVLVFPFDERFSPHLSVAVMERVRQAVPAENKFFRLVGRSNIELPTGVQIRKAKISPRGPLAPTWDIEVAGTGNFVCEGFIVHNSKLTMKYPAVVMTGPKAHGEVLSVAYAGAGQHQDAGAKMTHAAPETTSIIDSKSISKDGGRTTYRGLVKVAEGAYKTKSHVRCDALILDDDSRSDTYPYMEIAEKDARVAHEATVSKVGDDQLFYLMSRGLSEQQAMAMIVNGFIEPVVKTLPMEYAVELSRLIEMNMEGSVG